MFGSPFILHFGIMIVSKKFALYMGLHKRNSQKDLGKAFDSNAQPFPNTWAFYPLGQVADLNYVDYTSLW